VTSRPLKGEAPTIDLVVGYHKANTSPILRIFLSRIDDLTTRVSNKARRMGRVPTTKSARKWNSE
jgi:LysR family hca operon transcriptional activator